MRASSMVRKIITPPSRYVGKLMINDSANSIEVLYFMKNWIKLTFHNKTQLRDIYFYFYLSFVSRE